MRKVLALLVLTILEGCATVPAPPPPPRSAYIYPFQQPVLDVEQRPVPVGDADWTTCDEFADRGSIWYVVLGGREVLNSTAMAGWVGPLWTGLLIASSPWETAYDPAYAVAAAQLPLDAWKSIPDQVRRDLEEHYEYVMRHCLNKRGYPVPLPPREDFMTPSNRR